MYDMCTLRHLYLSFSVTNNVMWVIILDFFHYISFHFISRISSIKISKDNVKHSLNLDWTKKMNVLKMFRIIIKITSHLDRKYKQ